MTADFVSLLVCMGITLVLFIILGAIVTPWIVLYATPALLINIAFNLWIQHCVRAGNCKTLSWILFALWLVNGIVLVVTMAAMVHFKRKGASLIDKLNGTTNGDEDDG